jgi:hypothetical protein
VADLEPNVRLDVTHENLRRQVTVSGYNELAAIDEDARHLGLGNSLVGFLFGRDDGDYYRRSGATLEFAPPAAGRRSWRVRGYAEYQRPADVETDFALFRFWEDDFAFRSSLPAAEGWEFGGSLELDPWWGTDPRLAQAGFELLAQGGQFQPETGDGAAYARTSLIGRTILPVPGSMRLALEAGGGTSWGDPTPQRLWFVGGPRTLRGYDPRLVGGTSYVRGRAELARAFTWGSLALFSDWAWAGARDAFDASQGFTSVGTGLSILDGIVRIDAGWGLDPPRNFRLEFYLDAIL